MHLLPRVAGVACFVALAGCQGADGDNSGARLLPDAGPLLEAAFAECDPAYNEAAAQTLAGAGAMTEASFERSVELGNEDSLISVTAMRFNDLPLDAEFDDFIDCMLGETQAPDAVLTQALDDSDGSVSWESGVNWTWSSVDGRLESAVFTAFGE